MNREFSQIQQNPAKTGQRKSKELALVSFVFLGDCILDEPQVGVNMLA
jgi:hypothetical protein